MSNAASNYLENKLLDHTLKVGAFTQPAALYVGLFTNTSGNAAANLEAGILTDEISAGSYTRQSVAFNAAVAGSSTNSATVTFPAATASWGSIAYVAVIDAQTSGQVLFWGAPTVVKTIDTGDIYQIQSGNLTITIS